MDINDSPNSENSELALDKRVPAKPYNQMEFEEFLKMLGDTDVLAHATWQDIAGVLGVDNDTITSWRKHPRARQVIQREIQNQLKLYRKHSESDPKVTEKILRKLGLDFGGDKMQMDHNIEVKIIDYSKYKESRKELKLNGDSFTV